MALFHSLRRLRSIPQEWRYRSLMEGGGSCAGRNTPPPCPPCKPAPQPPCRVPSPPEQRALKAVCCAAPRGVRPPCPTPDPACSLSCDYAMKEKHKVSGLRSCEVPSTPTCGESDRVAKRLSLAEEARRRDYEQEVKDRAARPKQTIPDAPFRLGIERECARTTDGSMCMIPTTAAEPRRCCGPDRNPPPAKCVKVTPDDNCRIADQQHINPCAHKPRIIMEIDRSAALATSRKETKQSNVQKIAEDKECKPCSGASDKTKLKEGIKKKIMQSLKLDATSSVTKATTKSKEGNTSCDKGQCAESPDWCKNMPPPAPAPSTCRRPTLTDRIRSRSAPPCPNKPCRRKLHTNIQVITTEKEKPGKCGSLEEMLRARENLKEAAQGRFVTECKNHKTKQCTPPGGGLDVVVPPGIERVSVRVSLHSQNDSCGNHPAVSSYNLACSKQTKPCSSQTTTCEEQNSWLSLKNIQRKLSGGHRSDCPANKAPSKSPTESIPPNPPSTPKTNPIPQPGPCKRPPPSTCPPPNPCKDFRKKSKTEPKKFSSLAAILANSINGH